jgi:hypothetical protein
MLDELKVAKNCVEEVLINLMAKKVMSAGIQALPMRGVQASPSTSHGSRPSLAEVEKITKHRDDLANAKLILTILRDYILPLASTVSPDSVLRDFDYTLVTAYLPKGICAVRIQQDNIATLKFSDFNLGDRKNHNMISPHRYLTRTKGQTQGSMQNDYWLKREQYFMLLVDDYIRITTVFFLRKNS